ncbi:MAG: type 1 fimbrial protein [Metakosakonia sp.]|nr:fimbrial protein [Phytobacter sp.]MBV8872235.1 type 1 fimbrial protein [Phytobacter sp.]
MKSLLLVPMVITAISLTNNANAATNGTVNFSGKLNDQTCQVVLNNGSSASGIVILPTVPKENIPNKYDSTGKTAFTLKLTGCKASSTEFGVLAYFPPTAYTDTANSTNYSVLKNVETGTTAAEGVALIINQIIGNSEKRINVGLPITDPNYRYTTIAVGTTSATLRYNVAYVNHTNGTIKAGKVKGIAVYELAYQ